MESDDRWTDFLVDFNLFRLSLLVLDLVLHLACDWKGLLSLYGCTVAPPALYFRVFYWVGVHVAPRKSGVWYLPLLACSSGYQTVVMMFYHTYGCIS